MVEIPDLGLSGFLYRKELTYEYPKLNKKGKPFKGRHKVKEKEVWSLSVAGFIVLSGAAVFAAGAFTLHQKDTPFYAGIFGMMDYFLNALVKIVGAIGEAVGGLVPELPDIPGPQAIADRILGFVGL